MNGLKTKITEFFDAHNVPYRVIRYAGPVFTIAEIASQRGVVEEEMVKSILLREKKTNRYVMACVTGNARLDPRAVRVHLPAGWKRLSFATTDEVWQVTGYVLGAVSPICLRKQVPILFDEAIGRCTRVSISSGNPAAGLELDPRDLIRIARAQSAPIAEAYAEVNYETSYQPVI